MAKTIDEKIADLQRKKAAKEAGALLKAAAKHANKGEVSEALELAGEARSVLAGLVG